MLFTGEQIQRGQQAWLSAGGQQLGTVWGHGSYVAPDWSADWLHREATTLQDIRSASSSAGDADARPTPSAAAVDGARDATRCAATPTTRRPASSRSRPSARRRSARSRAHYDGLFGTDPRWRKLREQYAMTDGALPERPTARRSTAFFFWTSWAASTDRPGETDLSYTSNWPHEPLVGNTMSTSAAMWSMVSIILLLAGIAAMLWLHGRARARARGAGAGGRPAARRRRRRRR